VSAPVIEAIGLCLRPCTVAAEARKEPPRVIVAALRSAALRRSGAHAVLTQIYEVSDPAEATAISSIGIDHVGVLVGDGEFPRELTIERQKGSPQRFFHHQSSRHSS
jgi:hypothetical protein